MAFGNQATVWLPDLCAQSTGDGNYVIGIARWSEKYVTWENISQPWYVGPPGLVALGQAVKFAGAAAAATLVGTVTLAETSLITLALGVRRVTVALTGAITTGSYIAVPVSAPPSGYSIQDCYCGTTNQITVGIIVPVLAVATSYSIQVRIIRLL